MKNLPTDDNGKVMANGTESKTVWVEIGTGDDLYKTTNGWDAVVLPTESKGGEIRVRSFLDIDALGEDPIPFLFSSNPDGNGSISCQCGILLNVLKEAGDIHGYVWTGVSGRIISILTGA